VRRIKESNRKTGSLAGTGVAPLLMLIRIAAKILTVEIGIDYVCRGVQVNVLTTPCSTRK
jgi:hypothetical protein